MAMEIKRSKRLHKHALPIALMLAGLTLVSAGAITSYSVRHATQQPLIVRALFAPLTNMKSPNNSANFKFHTNIDDIPGAGKTAQTELTNPK